MTRPVRRHPCSDCGGPLDGAPSHGYCRRCHAKAQRASRARRRAATDALVAAARAVADDPTPHRLRRLRVVLASFAAITLLWTILWIAPRETFAQEMPPIEQGIATAVADRLGSWQETPLPAPPTTVVLDACAEMNHWRIVYGLPARFSDQPRQPAVSFGRQGLGWRESNCSNTAISGTGCCVGYWQLHSVIFRDHRMVDRLAACGATWQNVRGSSSAAKQRQACAARVLYDVAGLQPWAL